MHHPFIKKSLYQVTGDNGIGKSVGIDKLAVTEPCVLLLKKISAAPASAMNPKACLKKLADRQWPHRIDPITKEHEVEFGDVTDYHYEGSVPLKTNTKETAETCLQSSALFVFRGENQLKDIAKRGNRSQLTKALWALFIRSFVQNHEAKHLAILNSAEKFSGIFRIFIQKASTNHQDNDLFLNNAM